MTSDTRPVWLTEDEAKSGAYSWLHDLWLAAPADATEAVRGVIRCTRNESALEVARETLRTLGMPDPQPETT